MRSIVILFLFVGIISCQKEKTEHHPKSEINVPNFSNIDLKKVFPKQELTPKEKDSIRQIIHQYYQETWEFDNLWGSFLVAKGDQIIYENYRGFTQDHHQNPITKDTPLHIASASKTLTAMAILKLVESGKIHLNDTLQEFLPDFPYPNITIKSLLSQRSGLPKYEHFTAHIPQNCPELQKEFLTNTDLLNLLIKYRPPMARETNKGFMYNNLNFALLALVIEKTTKLPYPKAMQEMIFKPLKMKNTFVFQESDLENMPLTFYQKGEKPHPLDRFDLIYGDKNIYTTPRDLLNFSVAMYSEDFLPKNLKEQIFQPYSNEKPGVNNYGLGFRMKIFNDQQKLTYHNGWWHGTNSVFVHLLDSKTTIIAIGNKFSRRVYSAMMLSTLFEPFPYDKPVETVDSILLKASEIDTLKDKKKNDF